MTTQTHTLNPSVYNMAAVPNLFPDFRSVQVGEIFSNKGFVGFRYRFVCATSVGYSVLVSILNAFMQKIRSGASNVFGRLSEVKLIRGRFMEYVRVNKVLQNPLTSSFFPRVLHVFELSSLLQVMWVAAFRVIANMHEHFSFFNRSVVEQGKGKPVGQKLVLPPVSVAIVLGSSSPFPTNIWVFLKRNINVFPKVMVVIEAGYRIVNDIFKSVHMKSIYQSFGTSQPCYGGKV